jgi:hypothetical protein
MHYFLNAGIYFKREFVVDKLRRLISEFRG